MEGMTIHINPFLGKCIHGKDGAKFVGGRLVNPTCSHCKATTEYEAQRHV